MILPASIKAPLAALLFGFNTFFACLLIYPLAFVKFLIPLSRVHHFCTQMMVRIGELWISGNNLNMNLTQNISWKIDGLENLSHEKSYLIVCNHQSWMDIVILQRVFNRKIPFIRFFLKYELIYVPLLGWAWWALDFPFMKRHSRKYLELHPEKRNEDYESTKKACALFKGQSVTLLNFLEGTRFKKTKQLATQSPFENLLTPKVGGLAFVLNSMGEQFESLIDVTLYYPQGAVELWDALKGRLPEVVVHIRQHKIPSNLMNGNYSIDRNYRITLQKWVNEIWKQKDEELKKLRLVSPPGIEPGSNV